MKETFENKTGQSFTAGNTYDLKSDEKETAQNGENLAQNQVQHEALLSVRSGLDQD